MYAPLEEVYPRDDPLCPRVLHRCHSHEAEPRKNVREDGQESFGAVAEVERSVFEDSEVRIQAIFRCDHFNIASQLSHTCVSLRVVLSHDNVLRNR